MDIVDFILLLKGHVKKHCVAGNVLLVHSSKIRELIMKASKIRELSHSGSNAGLLV